MTRKRTSYKMSRSIRWAFDWKAWSPTETDFAHAISCVQLEEKERLGRFVFRKDVRASLAGRLMIRKFVSEYTGIRYDKIVLGRDDNNKPVLKHTPANVSFNVSHQGDYTVLAGEVRNVNLGVDVMKLEYTGGKELSEFFRIMNRNFSGSEWNEIKGISMQEAEQVSMFCRHWALKESYVKAIGIGIVTDLRMIDFKTNSNLVEQSLVTDTILFLNNVKQNWLFEETLINPEHCVAVAIQENGLAPKSEGTLFELIDNAKLLAHSVSLFPHDFEYARKYFEKVEHP